MLSMLTSRDYPRGCWPLPSLLCWDSVENTSVRWKNPITLRRVLAPSEVLPKRARVLLCSICKGALEKLPAHEVVFENTAR